VRLEAHFLTHFPSRKATPSLRALGLSGLQSDTKIRLPSSLPPLKVYEYDPVGSGLGNVVASMSVPQLSLIHHPNVRFSGPRTLRLYLTDSQCIDMLLDFTEWSLQAGTDLQEGLRSLEALLEDLSDEPSSTAFQRLSLPSPLRDCHWYKTAVKAVVEASERKGLEVDWDTTSENWRDESWWL
jgi:hypothetical protein